MRIEGRFFKGLRLGNKIECRNLQRSAVDVFLEKR